MQKTKVDPKFQFAGCFSQKAEEATDLVFVGLPDDSQSSFKKGSREGPDALRNAYDGRCYNATTELGVDLTEAVRDLGNIESGRTWLKTSDEFIRCGKQLFADKKIPFFCGGDHAVTVPIVHSLVALNTPVHIIQIDAHSDLYPEYEGSLTSHACVATRLLEFEHVASISQIGIRTLNETQQREMDRHGERLRIFTARELGDQQPRLPNIPPKSNVYFTVDLDGFDPAYAPAVSHPVPGGLTPRQVFGLLQKGGWRLAGMDVVELNPALDCHNLTAILAARVLHEAMGYAFSQNRKRES